MPADYAVLAPIYSAIGMDAFADAITPRLIDFAQRNDWMGRRIVDVGCGSGASLEWLTRRNYICAGYDTSAAMLELARTRLNSAGLYHDLHERDIRENRAEGNPFDLALALDVVNELNSLRDLEAMFTSVGSLLHANRLLIFDMYTIQGLTKAGSAGDQIIRNENSLTVVTSNHYDYDRQVHDQHYLVFHREGETWQRQEGARVLRGYPAQAISALLQRCGFQTRHVITPQFEEFEPGISSADRIIFVAEKQ